MTSNTYDKATALLPALLNERLPELGIDFALIYPSFGLSINGMSQGDLHRAAVRAYNMMTADMFAPFAERFAPVAIIPTHTPDEALEELEYAVVQRGFKAIMLRGNQERPIPSAAEEIKDRQKAAWYCDTIALDSPYDYEPLWQAVRRARRGRDPTLRQRPLAGSRLDQQLHLQPRRPLRRIEPRLRAGRFPGRSGAPLSKPQFWLHGRRSELGLSDVPRLDRTLGEAPPSRACSTRAKPTSPRCISLIDRYGDQRLKANCRRDHEQPGCIPARVQS